VKDALEVVAEHIVVETMVFSHSRIGRQEFAGRRVSLDHGSSWISKGHIVVRPDRLKTYSSVIRELTASEYFRREREGSVTLEIVAR